MLQHQDISGPLNRKPALPAPSDPQPSEAAQPGTCLPGTRTGPDTVWAPGDRCFSGTRMEAPPEVWGSTPFPYVTKTLLSQPLHIKGLGACGTWRPTPSYASPKLCRARLDLGPLLRGVQTVPGSCSVASRPVELTSASGSSYWLSRSCMSMQPMREIRSGAIEPSGLRYGRMMNNQDLGANRR